MPIDTLEPNDAKVTACEHIINYTFTNPLLLLQALNATSLRIYFANRYHSIQKNDALAVLGDTRMKSVLCRWWWDKSSRRIKAHWTAVHHEVCGNGALTALGKSIGLDACLILNPGLSTVSDKMLATAVKAVLGAVYLDGGEGALEGVMRELGLDQHLYL